MYNNKNTNNTIKKSYERYVDHILCQFHRSICGLLIANYILKKQQHEIDIIIHRSLTGSYVGVTLLGGRSIGWSVDWFVCLSESNV
jgi:hypothetical protein